MHIHSFIASVPYFTSSKFIRFAWKHHKRPFWERKISVTSALSAVNIWPIGKMKGKGEDRSEHGWKAGLSLKLTCLFDPLLLLPTFSFFFKFLFIYLFMAALGLRFCARAFSCCGKQGPLFITVRRPLTIAASLVAEHRLQTRRLSNCGSRA